MKLLKFFEEMTVLILLTILLVYDYFPDLPLANSIPKSILWFILGLILFGILFKRFRKPYHYSLKRFKWQLFTVIYILFLLGLLTVLGGQSTSDISFNNGFFWIILLISLFDIYSQYKKFKQSNKVEG